MVLQMEQPPDAPQGPNTEPDQRVFTKGPATDFTHSGLNQRLIDLQFDALPIEPLSDGLITYKYTCFDMLQVIKQEYQTTISNKSIRQQYQTRVSDNSIKQEYQTTVSNI
ncbi:hypothetical protein Ahia01_001264100 [Argonauta hians]